MKHLISELNGIANTLQYGDSIETKQEWEDLVDELWLEDLHDTCSKITAEFESLQEYFDNIEE